MKRLILFLICGIIAFYNIQAEQIPEFVQHRLDSVKKEAKRSLKEYRVWEFQTNGYTTLPLKLSSQFSDKEYLLIDNLGLNLYVGMVYDDEMRNRIVQLIRNEFQKWELDSLVNRQIGHNLSSLENNAMEMCKYDTMQIFRKTLDSLYLDVKSKEGTPYTKNMFKDRVFRLLELDTTSIFKQVYNELVERERERERKKYYSNGGYYFDYTYLAELCGYIGDKRFVQPLIELLDKSEDYQKEKVLTALVRLRAEPYYTNYVKQRMPRTIEQIQNESPKFRIDDLVYVIGTQESFRELSKYLLSEYPEAWDMIDLPDGVKRIPSPMWSKALAFIHDYILNKNLQEIVNVPQWSKKELTIIVYDWMQKNYGKYIIRRDW